MKLRALVTIVSLFASTSVVNPAFVNPAFAKQCIWNKAGFILNIAWIHKGKVVRRDQRPLGQGVCANDGDGTDYTIVLSIQDGKLASDFTKGAITVAAAALGAATGGAAAGGTSALAGFLANKGIPDPQEVFYTGIPGHDRYLDVWGTVWNPQTGPGGPIR